MPNPIFDLFEIVAEELALQDSRVLTPKDSQLNEEQSAIFDELKTELEAETTEEAIQKAVDFLAEHFRSKGSRLPFEYDAATGRFSVVDKDFLNFVKDTKSIRSLGKRSRDFEVRALQRLQLRATGELHRVGHPREHKKTREAFNAHLRNLGFNGHVLLDKEKDGGFDILWVLPIGTTPHKPIVSIQCKNGEFDMEAADQSIGAGSRSLSQHRGLQPAVHVPCVLFNDYIYPDILTKKQFNFVPLGLSDLSRPEIPVSAEAI
jgi:hypothetical protein